MTMLEVRDLDVYYGTIQALHGVGLSVAESEIVTLVGANGAGKSTLLRAISGVVALKGTVEFEGVSLAGRSPGPPPNQWYGRVWCTSPRAGAYSRGFR